MRRASLAAAVLLVCALAVLPFLALAGFAVRDAGSGSLWLGAEGLEQLTNTLGLVVGVGLIGALLGTANGWLTACCRFPGRRWLRLAQVLPLAAPAFVLAAVLVDLGSRWGFRVHGIGWALLLLSLTTYTYVFLLSTESFSGSGQRQLEACRSLGVGPWGSFRRVALPLALPSIGAGVALSGMEVVNELGAVELLGVPTLSRGILQRWQAEGDLPGAVGLALVALVLVSLLVGAERWMRQRSRRWNLGPGDAGTLQWPLRGWRCLLAQLLTLLPPMVSLGLPLTWLVASRDHLQSDPLEDLLALTLRSLGLALVAALLTVAGALVLAISGRWLANRLLGRLTFFAGMGYAVPGTVLALALMLIGGPLQLSPLLLLLWGYADRFMAVSKQGLDASFEQIPPSIDESATSLGCGWLAVLRRIHLPLLRGPLLVGGLLVFVDVVKELPLTFSLRPFDFDTLSVRVYQYASDERVGAALIPALLILALGLAASIALMPSLERRERGG
ncbi:iron ABC transporter permease [Cyanobium gracile UHCC 0139]|uniref:Iron ABC transporter permease n=1 Tax=Cyanobium gracile UHCC 0139 TaxID=3110308 RepID=A0ABU5RYG3_9CYAN|nr:iron ABC transporter permease [Cyanobium gracile]MEA5392817.1 iron ABC transporter permease [Cyanobium gracile UHCC 0139]